MKKLRTMLAIISTFTFGTAFAQTGTTDTATLNFIKKASVGGMKEVNAGKLAEQKSGNSDIRSFGNRMVTDHTKANDQLMKLVQSKGYNIPPPTSTETAPDAMLTGTSGRQFDKNYVSMMVKDHEKTVALFQKAANSVQDPDIKAFAQQTLPILQDHLTSIKTIAAKMNIQTTP